MELLEDMFAAETSAIQLTDISEMYPNAALGTL